MAAHAAPPIARGSPAGPPAGVGIPERIPLRGGIVTVHGYGLRLAVESGRLTISDGIGPHRRALRLSRYEATRRQLARVSIIGHTGTLSLDALRWLHGVGAALSVIDADGTLLLTAAPADPGDAALRRAQALAAHSAAGLAITRTLLDRKLAGQARLLAELGSGLPNATAASALISNLRAQLAAVSGFPGRPAGWDGVGDPEPEEEAPPASGCASAWEPHPSATLAILRLIEARAAEVYWSALAAVEVPFVRLSRDRIPEHWRTFGQRHSALSGSPRHALTPAHATLNYLYAIAETEVRVALLSAGLDPALGILHTDQGSRASMALDILDAIRPEVDGWALALLRDRPLPGFPGRPAGWGGLSLHDVGELPSGVVRLRPGFASLLAETAPRWRELAVTAVEAVTTMLRELAAEIIPEAPPTGRVSRAPRALGARVAAVPGGGRLLRGRPSTPPPAPGRCRECGSAVSQGRVLCDRCMAAWRVENAERVTLAGPAALARLRDAGLDPAHGREAEARRRTTQRAHREADAAWERQHGSGDPARWQRLRPRLDDIPLTALREATGYSLRHCSRFRAGLVIPHPRVWAALERLTARS